MKKLSGNSLCFTVSIREVIKYRFSPMSQLRKKPKAKRLFKRKKKTKVDKINVCKGNSQKK